MKYRFPFYLLGLVLPFFVYAQTPVDTTYKTIDFEFTGFHQELTWNPDTWSFDQSIDVGMKNTGQAPKAATLQIQITNHFFHIGDKTISKTIPLDQNQSYQETFHFQAPKFSFLTTEATLSFQNQSNHTISKNAPILSSWSIPWVETFILSGILGLWLFIFLIRSFAIQYKKARLPIYDVQEGDSLGSVAEKTNTPWKRLVQYNRIKKPYTIIPGTALYVHCIPMDLGKEIEVTGGDQTETVETQVMETSMRPHFFPTWAKTLVALFLVVGILSLGMILFIQYQQKKVEKALTTFQTPQPSVTITPEPPTIPEAVVPMVVLNKQDIHVEILNGTTIPGKAQQMKTSLQKEGYIIDTIGNSQKSNISLTSISYGTDEEEAAKLVSTSLNALGYQTSLIFDVNLPSKPFIRIIIGKTGLPQ